METITKMAKPDSSFNTIRWVARISGTLMVAFTLFMAIGSFIEGYHRNSSQSSYPFDTITTITFVFAGIGLMGLIIALWREGLGSIISLSALVIFIALVAFNPEIHFSFILLIILFPGILYLAYWLNAAKSKNMQKP